jgi:DNA-directed RNA polymerase sigma subunit (sigma70/sigma32)
VSRKLNQLLDLIPEFEKMILKKRFGLEEGNYGNDAKAKDIGEQLGFSRQRVQQYEVRAMDRLKKEIQKSGYNLN